MGYGLSGQMRGCAAVFVLAGWLLAAPAWGQVGGKMAGGAFSPVASSVFNEKARVATLKKQAKKGDAVAALKLGYLYRLGRKVKKDPGQAVRWFRQAAARGNAEAQLQMAVMYAAGEGVKQDYGAMLRWLEKSAENGYGLSQLQLGLLYAKGITVAQDMAMAQMWLGFAAEQPGEVGQMARKALANFRQDAADTGTDWMALPLWQETAERYGRALAALQAGADGNQPHAQFMLGLVFYWLGEQANSGQDGFYREAARRFRQAAEQGEMPAQYLLGVMYRDGKGRGQSETEALSWLEKAAQGGYAPAQAALGAEYAHPGRQDAEQARFWYGKALAAGNGEAQAYFAERAAVDGAPGKRDMPVRQWDARDQYVMAMAYEKGEGVPQDWEQAAAWYRMAASGLLLPAQRRLGMAYLEGMGVAADAAEAAAWLNLAAEQGDAQAACALAGLYADGRGVEKDEGRAFALYGTAAQAGMPPAQEALGVMYLEGRGTKKDAAQALQWLEKAAVHSGSAIRRVLAIMQEDVQEAGQPKDEF